MGIFRQFPYTNFHEMNLDWLLANMKKLMSDWENFVVDWGKEVAAEVSKWLEAHPEVTTTVQDHSISEIKLTPELATKTVKDYYTPQMFGAKGDGVTDDTAAFAACANLNPVIIPEGDYVINSEVKLNHVLKDLGTYTNFKPLYRKDINFKLNNLGYGDYIDLPVATSYIEACIYLNEQYYVTCRNYTTNVSYIAIYTKDFQYLHSMDLRAIYGIATSMHTDGTYIYIDFDSGYHVRYNDDLTGEFDIFNDEYKFIIPYNNYFYAVKLYGSTMSDIIISKMDGYGGTILSTDRVSVPYSTPQAGTIYNGILILTCVETNVFEPWTIRVVDIATLDVNEIVFNSAVELENFFDRDGELCIAGNNYGMNGLFRIGNLNGIDNPFIQYFGVDGERGNPSILVGARYGCYRIINGTSMNFPENVGDFLSLTDAKFFISNTNKLYYYKSGWHYVGNVNSLSTTFTVSWGSVSFNGGVRNSSGMVQLTCNGGGGTGLTSGAVIGTIPVNYRPTTSTNILGIARTSGGWSSATIHVVMVTINPDTGAMTINGNDTELADVQYLTLSGCWTTSN